MTPADELFAQDGEPNSAARIGPMTLPRGQLNASPAVLRTTSSPPTAPVVATCKYMSANILNMSSSVQPAAGGYRPARFEFYFYSTRSY